MIDPRSIAFDIDGVFADILTLFFDIASNDYNINGFKHEDVTSYDLKDCLDMDPVIIDHIISIIQNGTFETVLKPIDGAPEVLRRLGESCGRVLFVTARSQKYPIYKWILDVLPLDSSVIDVVATGAHEGKTDVLLDRNISYFVEDRLETCFVLKDAGITPVLFKQPWNRKEHPFLEVGTWSELESLISI